MLADLPRIALLGPVGIEVAALFEAVTRVYPSEKVTKSSLAGGVVSRAQVQWISTGAGYSRFEFVAMTCDLDFEGVYQPLFESAAGVVALIPTDPSRLGEAHRILGLAKAAIRRAALLDESLPVVIQYQWKPEHLGVVAPETVDRDLGLSSQCGRILSRFDHEDQFEGITTLLAMLQTSKA